MKSRGSDTSNSTHPNPYRNPFGSLAAREPGRELKFRMLFTLEPDVRARHRSEDVDEPVFTLDLLQEADDNRKRQEVQ